MRKVLTNGRYLTQTTELLFIKYRNDVTRWFQCNEKIVLNTNYVTCTEFIRNIPDIGTTVQNHYGI